jgi:outer membrane lipoprotein carrier protein
LFGYRPVAAVALCIAFSPVWAQTGIERIESFLNEVGSLQAPFKQTLFDEDLNRLEDSRGTMYLQRPGHFRWDYVSPYAQSIMSNGQTLWIYDSELSQVIVKHLDATAASSPSMLLTSDEPLETHFDVDELPSESGVVWVQLTPKSQEVSFSVIRIAFAEADLRTMELVDSFGQMTQINFLEVEKNTELDEAFFVMILPEGVDVISDGQE